MILIVDDEPSMRMLIGMILYPLASPGGGRGREARPSEGGARLPALAICDVLMPGIDGLSSCGAQAHARAECRLHQRPPHRRVLVAGRPELPPLPGEALDNVQLIAW